MKTRQNYLSSAFVASLLISATVIQAQARPDTRYLACSTVVSIIQSNGAAVLNTSAYKYKKYVKNHAYCNLNEATKRAYVPTSDNRRCFIGFYCYDPTIRFD